MLAPTLTANIDNAVWRATLWRPIKIPSALLGFRTRSHQRDMTAQMLSFSVFCERVVRNITILESVTAVSCL